MDKTTDQEEPEAPASGRILRIRSPSICDKYGSAKQKNSWYRADARKQMLVTVISIRTVLTTADTISNTIRIDAERLEAKVIRIAP